MKEKEVVEDDQQAIMTMIRNAVMDMESKGIYQWDSIYPNEKVIYDDLVSGNLYVYQDYENIKGIVVLNEHQDREYEEIDWRYNSGRPLIVHRLCIDPRCQGQGIARLLMNYAEEYASESGYESIRLDAFINNARACHLYQKLEYQKVGIVRFRKGEFYCFEKSLLCE